jgi:anti-sigma regulatory factor (Ser/Thr protein kinase)
MDPSPHTTPPGRAVPVNTPWPLVNHLSLWVLPVAVSVARTQVKILLIEWDLRPLSESAELCVTELMSNALKAVNDLPRHLRQAIGLRVSSDGAQVLLEVWDCCSKLPAVSEATGSELPSLDLEGGRGLFLVESLSAKWSYYATEEWGGKVVWAMLG